MHYRSTNWLICVHRVYHLHASAVGLRHRFRIEYRTSCQVAKRVAISRALAMAPEMLSMDEPTPSLDPARRGDVVAILRNLAVPRLSSRATAKNSCGAAHIACSR